MALIGISNFETEEWVHPLDPSIVHYPIFLADNKTPHPKSGETDIEASREAGATIFMLGSLTADQRAFIADKTGVVQEDNGEGGMRLIHRNGSRNLEACRFGLLGWENLKDRIGGNDIPFIKVNRIIVGQQYSVPSNETLQRLGVLLWTDIGERVLERNSMSDSLLKNLNGQAPQSTSSQVSTVEPVSPQSENAEDANAMSHGATA